MNKNIEELLSAMDEFNKKFSVYNSQRGQDTVYYSILMSCISEIILSKKLFKRNKDILQFLEIQFGLTLPEYVGKNRSLILGRVLKYISEIDSTSRIKEVLNSLYIFLQKITLEENKDVLTWRDVIENVDLKVV